uniref:Uncharacterized protein n=1 Tax=Acrobeloides nanus TaxID=290746 RepID=A0A914CLB1_9BILA
MRYCLLISFCLLLCLSASLAVIPSRDAVAAQHFQGSAEESIRNSNERLQRRRRAPKPGLLKGAAIGALAGGAIGAIAG